MDAEEPRGRWPRYVYGVGQEPDPRFSLANERTFLAWIRTGLAFVTAGVGVSALAHLAPSLAGRVTAAGIVLILCGLLSGFTGLLRWARNERAMRLGSPLASPTMLPMLTITLLLVAGLAGFVLL